MEIHFSARDWLGHGHGENPDFDNVVLHVVLYLVKPDDPPTRTFSGSRVPTVSLLDCLWYDLEEYASEDSIIDSTGVSLEDAIEPLYRRSVEDCRSVFVEKAWERWNLKCGFARKRIDRLGWEEACHTTAMEILGFSENCIIMLRVATAVSLAELREAPPDLESLYEIGGGMWTIRGNRPANYPGLRLEQYLHWVAENPGWPRALERWASTRPVDGILTSEPTGVLRKATEMPGLKRKIRARVCSDCVGGSKLDTLIWEGVLPLLSARRAFSFRKLWFHWYAGNAPKEASSSLRKLGVIEPKRSR